MTMIQGMTETTPGTMIGGNNGNMTAIDGLSGQQVMTTAETTSSAAAAQAQALIQARFAMALRRPRNWMTVQLRLLDECKRYGFAESALYAKPIGGDKVVEGLSIRFAESVMRNVSNVHASTMVVFDDNRKRLIQVNVTDLESNATYTADIVIEKTVERSKLRPRQDALGSRMNSYGKRVYIVEATEGDMLTKEGAQVSKALRNLVLRLLPGDIREACDTQIRRTLTEADKRDPKAKYAELAAAYFALGVTPDDLEQYVGHRLEQVTPEEVGELRMVYRAVKDGETNWRDALEAKTEGREVKGADKAAEEEEKRKQTDKLIDELKGRGASKPAEKASEAKAAPDERDAEWMEGKDQKK